MNPPTDHRERAAELEHDGGLIRDLDLLAQQHNRRRAMRMLGAGAAVAATGAARAAGCVLIPSETAGPYPADGSNSASGGGGGTTNALLLSGIVRRDIRSSFGSATGTAEGLPLAVRLALVNTGSSCARLGGHAVYLWHCTREGLYSMYSAGVTNQNYLRGVQITDADGIVTFKTIFPGCYSGRMPHIHFEVYRSATTATAYSNALRTSQMAFPTTLCQRIYANVSGYEQSVGNLSRMSFATDNVFSDGYESQLATVGSDFASGVTATLQVGISV